MKIEQAIEHALGGKVIGRHHASFPYDFLVLVQGRSMVPTFDPMKSALGEDVMINVLHHFDGINMTSHNTCDMTLNVQLTCNDLMADDWVAIDGQTARDGIFPDPASMTN